MQSYVLKLIRLVSWQAHGDGRTSGSKFDLNLNIHMIWNQFLLIHSVFP